MTDQPDTIIPRVKVNYFKGAMGKCLTDEQELTCYVDSLVSHILRNNHDYEDGALERIQSSINKLGEMFASLCSLLVERNVIKFEDLDDVVGTDHRVESVSLIQFTLEDEPKKDGPITVLDLASYRLGRDASTGQDFEDADLPIMAGCEICQASVAAYNSCPSKSGYIRCAKGCIGNLGFATVEEANQAIFQGGMPTDELHNHPVRE